MYFLSVILNLIFKHIFLQITEPKEEEKKEDDDDSDDIAIVGVSPASKMTVIISNNIFSFIIA